ncbi:hypothetical protein PRIC1_011432 [Phytophthora ramorum]
MLAEVDPDTIKTRPGAKPPGFYVSLVNEVDAFPPNERIPRVPEVLRALTISINEDDSCEQQFRVTAYLKTIIEWIQQGKEQNHHLGLYFAFANSVRWFTSKLPASSQKVGLIRILKAFFAVLRKTKLQQQWQQ